MGEVDGGEADFDVDDVFGVFSSLCFAGCGEVLSDGLAGADVPAGADGA